MARSTYIYLVQYNGLPVSGFTVKWELLRWLERNPGEYRIFRLSDGAHREPTDVTDEMLDSVETDD